MVKNKLGDRILSLCILIIIFLFFSFRMFRIQSLNDIALNNPLNENTNITKNLECYS